MLYIFFFEIQIWSHWQWWSGTTNYKYFISEFYSSKRSNESGDPKSQKKNEKKSEKEKVNSSSARDKLNLAQIKQMGGSQFKFGVLTKIVRHMKARHLDGKILFIFMWPLNKIPNDEFAQTLKNYFPNIFGNFYKTFYL